MRRIIDCNWSISYGEKLSTPIADDIRVRRNNKEVIRVRRNSNKNY